MKSFAHDESQALIPTGSTEAMGSRGWNSKAAAGAFSRTRARPLVLVFVSIFVLFGAASQPLAAHAADPEPNTKRVVYGGKLEDSQGRPIGGIFPLTFSFYRTDKGGRSQWTESHFVAVDNGVYAVELGRIKPLPANLDTKRVFLGVAVTGGKEIVREKLAADAAVASPQAPGTTTVPTVVASNTNEQIGAPPQPAKGSYADHAGFADEAEHAKNSDAVGGMTAADIKALAKSTQAGAASAKVKIGSAKRYSDPAGGTGGTPFTLQCPQGYVVTGIKGQAAAFLDQISVICSPLE